MVEENTKIENAISETIDVLNGSLRELQERTKATMQAAAPGKHSKIFYDSFIEYFNIEYLRADGYHLRYDCDLNEYFEYNPDTGLFEQQKIQKINKMMLDWGSRIGVDEEISNQRLKMLHVKIQAETYIEHDQWNPKAEEFLVCNNGVIDLATKRRLAHSPVYLATQKLNFEFHDTPGDTPLIDSIRVLGNPDYPDVDPRVEFFEFERFVQAILYYDLKNEQALFIYGPTGSSKGTILSMLAEVLDNACTGGSLNDLNDERYSMVPFLNKRVFIDFDSRCDSLNKKGLETFLKITGRDSERPQFVSLKFVKHFQTVIRAFIIVATNQFARLPVSTNTLAFFRRVKIVQFLGQPVFDITFKDRIRAEMDDWISELILMDYVPWIDNTFDREDWADRMGEIWDFSANPIRRYCCEMFERETSDLKEICQEDVLDWIRQRFIADKYQIPNDNYLKQLVTSEMAAIRIRKSPPKHGIHYYYPIKIKKDWEELCIGDKAVQVVIQKLNAKKKNISSMKKRKLQAAATNTKPIEDHISVSGVSGEFSEDEESDPDPAMFTDPSEKLKLIIQKAQEFNEFDYTDLYEALFDKFKSKDEFSFYFAEAQKTGIIAPGDPDRFKWCQDPEGDQKGIKK